MKRITFLLAIVSITIALSGCAYGDVVNDVSCSQETGNVSTMTNAPESTDHVDASNLSWYEKINFNKHSTVNDWSSRIIESAGIFYYIANDGLRKYDSKIDLDTLLIEGDFNDIIMYENDIYYNTDDTVFKLSVESMNGIKIWDRTMHINDHFISIYDFCLHNDYLYIEYTGVDCVRYNLKTHVTEEAVEDFSSLVILDNSYMYTHHVKRDFQIYCMDSDTRVVSMVRGDGKPYTDSDKIRYDDLETANGAVYYVIREQSSIYKYNENGDDLLIYEEPSNGNSYPRILNSVNDDKLYFVSMNSDNKYSIYEYDGNNEPNIILDGIAYKSYSTISITESAIFWVEYIAEGEAKVCMKSR